MGAQLAHVTMGARWPAAWDALMWGPSAIPGKGGAFFFGCCVSQIYVYLSPWPTPNEYPLPDENGVS